MTASLTSNSDQYDVIWHNDDWGQTWAHLLEPMDDVAANKFVALGRDEHDIAVGAHFARLSVPHDFVSGEVIPLA